MVRVSTLVALPLALTAKLASAFPVVAAPPLTGLDNVDKAEITACLDRHSIITEKQQIGGIVVPALANCLRELQDKKGVPVLKETPKADESALLEKRQRQASILVRGECIIEVEHLHVPLEQEDFLIDHCFQRKPKEKEEEEKKEEEKKEEEKEKEKASSALVEKRWLPVIVTASCVQELKDQDTPAEQSAIDDCVRQKLSPASPAEETRQPESALVEKRQFFLPTVIASCIQVMQDSPLLADLAVASVFGS